MLTARVGHLSWTCNGVRGKEPRETMLLEEADNEYAVQILKRASMRIYN